MVIADIALDQADDIIAEIKSLGQQGIATKLDVTDASSVQATTDRLVSEFGRIDLLVNCHGLTTRMPSVPSI